jgi:hypothetical protein
LLLLLLLMMMTMMKMVTMMMMMAMLMRMVFLVAILVAFLVTFPAVSLALWVNLSSKRRGERSARCLMMLPLLGMTLKILMTLQYCLSAPFTRSLSSFKTIVLCFQKVTRIEE